MSADFIPPLAPIEAALGPAALGAPLPAAVSGPGFGQLVSHGLQEVNEQLVASQADLQHLALGDAQSLHQTMIRLEEARMSFQLLMQVRSRVLEAYQEVMKMQV